MIYLNTVIRRKCYYDSSVLHPNLVYVLEVKYKYEWQKKMKAETLGY
jgi:hypothetical protein